MIEYWSSLHWIYNNAGVGGLIRFICWYSQVTNNFLSLISSSNHLTAWAIVVFLICFVSSTERFNRTLNQITWQQTVSNSNRSMAIVMIWLLLWYNFNKLKSLNVIHVYIYPNQWTYRGISWDIYQYFSQISPCTHLVVNVQMYECSLFLVWIASSVHRMLLVW